MQDASEAHLGRLAIPEISDVGQQQVVIGQSGICTAVHPQLPSLSMPGMQGTDLGM